MAGVPIVLLKEGTEQAQGKRQIVSNIQACQVVADSVRTTLGPRGMDKLIADDRGKWKKKRFEIRLKKLANFIIFGKITRFYLIYINFLPQLGKATISNDGATILKLLDIVFPAAKLLVDIAKSQDAEVSLKFFFFLGYFYKNFVLICRSATVRRRLFFWRRNF